MSFSDFCKEFTRMDICRVFSDTWFSMDPIQDTWKPNENSVGLPREGNKNVDLTKNTQYGITVTKRCTLYI